MEEVRITTGRRVEGLRALCRRIGYSEGHVSLVLRGQRLASRALAARLRRLGIEVAAGRKPGSPRKAVAG